MRALIRGEEVIVEPFSQWVESHLDWMIGAEKDSDGNPIAGDGWILVEDYVPPNTDNDGWYDASNIPTEMVVTITERDTPSKTKELGLID